MGAAVMEFEHDTFGLGYNKFYGLSILSDICGLCGELFTEKACATPRPSVFMLARG